MLRKLLLAGAAALLCAPALAQSPPMNPAMTYGFVPTVGQWNAWFQQKQDFLGFVPLNTQGGSMTGELFTQAATTLNAGLNIPPGFAPASPQNGDMWETSAGLFIQVAGVTIGPLAAISQTTAQLINLSGQTPPTADTGTLLQGLSANGVVSRTEMTAAAAAAAFTGRRADTSFIAPSAVQSGELIVTFNGFAYDGTSWPIAPNGGYHIYADGNWTNTSHPTKLCMAVTPASSTTMADQLCLYNDGGVTLGAVSDQGPGTINSAGAMYIAGIPVIATNTPVTGVFGRTGAVVGASGDYTTNQLNTNVSGSTPATGKLGELLTIGAITGPVASSTSTITFTNGSANIVWASNTPVLGQIVSMTTSSALPTNFAANTNYYVVSVVGTTVQLSATPAGTAILAGSAGTGTQTGDPYAKPATATMQDITYLTISAGDWACAGSMYMDAAAQGASLTQVILQLNTTSNTALANATFGQTLVGYGTTQAIDLSEQVEQDISVSGSTKVFLSVSATFTGQRPFVRGSIHCRRED